MVVVAAFHTLTGTTEAGLVGYYRAEGCTAITIADAIPTFSKIIAYEEEYIFGEVLIYDNGFWDGGGSTMIRLLIYNDGWIVAFFDRQAYAQQGVSASPYISDYTIGALTIEYINQYSGWQLEVTSSTDPNCPTGTSFTISTTTTNGRVTILHDDKDEYYFHTGYSYNLNICSSNGMMVWWGHTTDTNGNPPLYSNKLYRAIYQVWQYLKYSSNSTNRSNSTVSKAFLDDGGIFTDETTDFNDGDTSDCPLIPSTEAIDDAFYYGSSNKFQGLQLNVGQIGVGNTIDWEYWDGSAWSSLVVTDLTNGFTDLINHIHIVDDTTNLVTATDATDQTTLNTLLNEIKSDYNVHRILTTFHDAADNANVITSANASDLNTSMTLANEIKTDINAHRSQSGIHPYDDEGNIITSDNGTDLATTIILANEIKVDYNAHLTATQIANTITFTPQDDWIKTLVNLSEQYWIRSRVSVAGYTTQPLLTQGWIIIADSIINYLDPGFGLYSFEYTSANHILMTGISGYDITKYFTLMLLSGLTIYAHDISYSIYKYYSYPYHHYGGQILLNGQDIYKYRYQSLAEISYKNRNITTMFNTIDIQNIFRVLSTGQATSCSKHNVAVLLYTS